MVGKVVDIWLGVPRGECGRAKWSRGRNGGSDGLSCWRAESKTAL